MYKVVTDSDYLGITPAFMRLHTKIDADAETELVTQYIKSATRAAERCVHYPILEKVLEFKFDKIESVLTLIHGVSEITSILYNDADDNEQTLDSSDYELNEYGGLACVEVSNIPSSSSKVKVLVKAGKADATTISDNLKIAIALMSAHMYFKRDDGMKKFPSTAEYYLDLESYPYYEN